MTKLIINTISSEKITPKKQMAEGDFTFTAGYIDRDGYKISWRIWKGYSVRNPTEGDMAKQAQKFLNETGDLHPYLEGYDINQEARTIHMGFGN